MALSLQEIFGPSAIQSGDQITFDLSDFASTGLSGASPSPTQALAALMKYCKANLIDYDDPAVGCAAAQFGTDPSLVTRGTVQQIANPVTLNFYEAYNGGFDPDNVIA